MAVAGFFIMSLKPACCFLQIDRLQNNSQARMHLEIWKNALAHKKFLKIILSFHSCQMSWNIFHVVLDCLQGGRNAWPEWGYKFKGGMVWNHVTPGMPWCSRLAVVASQIFFWEEKATVEDWAINTLSLFQFLYKRYMPLKSLICNWVATMWEIKQS